MLQNKTMKHLSRARTQDTGRATIPDVYDRNIKERIKYLKKCLKDIKNDILTHHK